VGYARDFGPWRRVVIQPRLKCHRCETFLVSGVPAFLCQTTGAYLCGPCGVAVLGQVFNLKRGGVKT